MIGACCRNRALVDCVMEHSRFRGAPWQDIAFATVRHGLELLFEHRTLGIKGFHEMELVPPF